MNIPMNNFILFSELAVDEDFSVDDGDGDDGNCEEINCETIPNVMFEELEADFLNHNSIIVIRCAAQLQFSSFGFFKRNR